MLFPESERGWFCAMLFAVCTVRVTVVAALPAAIEFGEKVAVAPVGNPLTLNEIA
jgi:hypothetical protein